MKILLVALFGMLGVLIRYAISGSSNGFPIRTLAINCVGALFAGAIYVLASERGLISPMLKSALLVGLLGGLTTLSAFCLETVQLWEGRAPGYAIFYLALTPSAGVLSCWLGVALTRWLA